MIPSDLKDNSSFKGTYIYTTNSNALVEDTYICRTADGTGKMDSVDDSIIYAELIELKDDKLIFQFSVPEKIGNE